MRERADGRTGGRLNEGTAEWKDGGRPNGRMAGKEEGREGGRATGRTTRQQDGRAVGRATGPGEWRNGRADEQMEQAAGRAGNWTGE